MGSSQISKKLGFDISRFAEPRQWSKALAVVEILQQSGIEPHRSLANRRRFWGLASHLDGQFKRERRWTIGFREHSILNKLIGFVKLEVQQSRGWFKRKSKGDHEFSVEMEGPLKQFWETELMSILWSVKRTSILGKDTNFSCQKEVKLQNSSLSGDQKLVIFHLFHWHRIVWNDHSRSNIRVFLFGKLQRVQGLPYP